MKSWSRFAVYAGLAGVVLFYPFFALPVGADETRSRQWHLAALSVEQAHQFCVGVGVTVAVIDTGVDHSHQDIVRNVLPGTDFLESGGIGWTDTDGHGTAMAGLIAAHGRGSVGIMGIAPQAKILPIKVGESAGWTVINKAVDWAVSQGAKVINISGGSPGANLADRRAIDRAIEKDVVVVAAAGSPENSLGVRFPAGYPGVVAVAGTDRNGNHSSSSTVGQSIVLAAPADDLLSIGLMSRTHVGTGTSGAAAIVSGAVALVRARYPGLKARQVVDHLTATAVDKGASGRDEVYGFGLIDIVAALTIDPSVSGRKVESSLLSSSSGFRNTSTRQFLTFSAIILAMLTAVGLTTVIARRH